MKELDIEKLLLQMTEDDFDNIKKIRKVFGSLSYQDENSISILHILVKQKYNEQKCLLAIRSLLKFGINPNLEDNNSKCNFIQIAIYNGYSKEFILKVIKEALKYNLNVGKIYGSKIIDRVSFHNIYEKNVINIYNLLCNFNLNTYDSNYLNDSNISNYINRMGYNKLKKSKVNALNNELSKNNYQKYEEIKEKELKEKELNKLNELGIILNKKNYYSNLALGRENELKEIMVSLAQDKVMPLLVGKSGVGKTTIIDELAYRIQKDQVPDFLKNKLILEVNPNNLVAGCKYVGQFNEKMKTLCELCKKYNVLLFIDELHNIYGVGSTEKSDVDMANILKSYIDRDDLKVIGTTTDYEYEKFFAKDALKRRFEKIYIEEPSENILYDIVEKVIDDNLKKNNLIFKDEEIKQKIINILIKYTEDRYRVYNDKMNNPHLIISIIDKAFAYAKVFGIDYMEKDFFISSIKSCERIYSSAREKAINELENIENNEKNINSKILKLDFVNKRKM